MSAEVQYQNGAGASGDGGAPEEPVTVFFVASQGISQRCLLESELLDMFLAAGVRVVALVPDPTEPYLQENFVPRGVVLEQIRRKYEGKRGGLIRLALTYLRRYSVPGHKSPAFRNRFLLKNRKYQEETSRPRFYAFLRLLITKLLWRSPRARRRIARWDQRWNREEGHADLFERYRPSLAVAGTLGHIRWDGIVLREAQALGVPVASAMVSWDNASSKEYRMIEPDLVIAWSEEMLEHLRVFQDVDPARIRIAGAYHWDRYRRPGALLSRQELFEELGLDPERRLVLFAAPPPKSYVAAGRFAEGLANAMRNGDFGEPVQMVVRLHPNSFTRDTRNKVIAQVEEVVAAHDNVFLSVPEIVSTSLGGAVSRRDMILLGSLIAQADVLINLFSTTTLEAFLADTPVVLVNDDVGLNEEELARAGAARYDEFAHLHGIQEGCGGPEAVARSTEDAISRTRVYLADRSVDSEARAAVAERECGPMDGYAARRAARALLELAGLSPARIAAAEASIDAAPSDMASAPASAGVGSGRDPSLSA